MSTGPHSEECSAALVQGSAAAACRAFSAWCGYGYMTGFFLIASRRPSSIAMVLPSSRVLWNALSEGPPDAARSASMRMEFTEALLKEVMAIQTDEVDRRHRLIRAGMAAAAVSGIAFIALLIWLAAAGFEAAASAAIIAGTSSYLLLGYRAAWTDTSLFEAACCRVPPEQYLPWLGGDTGSAR